MSFIRVSQTPPFMCSTLLFFPLAVSLWSRTQKYLKIHAGKWRKTIVQKCLFPFIFFIFLNRIERKNTVWHQKGWDQSCASLECLSFDSVFLNPKMDQQKNYFLILRTRQMQNGKSLSEFWNAFVRDHSLFPSTFSSSSSTSSISSSSSSSSSTAKPISNPPPPFSSSSSSPGDAATWINRHSFSHNHKIERVSYFLILRLPLWPLHCWSNLGPPGRR